jgi:opacity protein-like surface antigen
MGLELGGASLNSPYKEYDYRTYRNITKTISSTDFALAYNLGYMFNSYFGVEAVVWDMIGEENYFGDNNNSIIAGVMLKINYPFGDRFNIYARLGGGFLISTYSYESIYPDYDEITERTDAHTALLYGFGISFYPAAHHEIGLNYRGSLSENIYKKGLEENAPNHTLIDAYTLSYAYHFRY